MYMYNHVAEYFLHADMPNLPGIPIHEHSQADSCHTAVDMEGAAKAAAEHIVVEVEQGRIYFLGYFCCQSRLLC